MISVSRKNDAVISVCQNNDSKTIEIQQMNEAATALIGYTAEELVGKSLLDIVGPAVKDNIESYLEFEEGGNDLASVLTKTRRMQLISNKGDIVPVSLKIFSVVAAYKNARFELLMRDNSFSEKMEQLKDDYEKDTLPGLEFFEKSFELVSRSVSNNNIIACLVVLSITGYKLLIDCLPEENVKVLLNEIAQRYYSTSRLDDTIGYLGEGKIGLFIVDCPPQTISRVIERITGKITATPITLPNDEFISVTVQSRYTPVTKDATLKELIALCE